MDELQRVIDIAASRSRGMLSKLIGKLAQAETGAVLPTVNNAMLILANDPGLRGLLGFDEFRSEHLLMSPPPPLEEGHKPLPGPFPRPWQGEDLVMILGYLQRMFSSRFSRQTVEDAVLAEASRNRFHPVRDWLAGLRWDGKPRLDQWLHKAFGAEASDYVAAVGAKFLLAAVRRVRQPGCKFDYLLVLEGPQGIGKSTVFKALFGENSFSDSLPAALESKDAAIGLLGMWCVELAEIEQVVRAELEVMKAFLSRAVDRYRPPYGRAYVERPRQGVLVGTTNSLDYLRDSTGNRRFWPVRCQYADVPWIRAEREQLWAEAASREAAGESIWLDDHDVQDSAVAEQDKRMEEDPWLAPIENHLNFATGRVSASALLSGPLGIPLERQDQRQKRRVASIMRGLGWVQGDLFRDGLTRVRTWQKPP